MKKELLSPLVGTSFRPLGKAVLAILPAGQSLILESEPDNPFDPNAIKVSVHLGSVPIEPNAHKSLIAQLEQAVAQNELDASNPIVQLGYLPASGGRFDTHKCGNKEVMPILQGSPDWNATLTFSPEAKPLVRVEYWQDEA